MELFHSHCLETQISKSEIIPVAHHHVPVSAPIKNPQKNVVSFKRYMFPGLFERGMLGKFMTILRSSIQGDRQGCTRTPIPTYTPNMGNPLNKPYIMWLFFIGYK